MTMVHKIFIFLCLCFSFWNSSFAIENTQELTREVIFQYIWKNILTSTPKSYKYIHLEFLDVQKENINYETLQKFVYYDLIENKRLKINLKLSLNSYVFFSIIEKQIGYDFVNESNIWLLKSKNTTYWDLILVHSILQTLVINKSQSLEQIFWDTEKIKIFQDVYNTLLTEHYESINIDKNKLIYSVIEWLAKWSQDKFTTYFPPTENKNFQESLSWEFEGIWAYVDMEIPWELKIIAPLKWSPSEKIWIKSGDIIYKINDIQITKNMTLTEAVSMIKWPAGTKVILEISRWGEKLKFEVIREKIIMNDVEYKILNNSFFYIQMNIFWDKIFNQTNEAIQELKKHTEIKKIIIDLRNNPGWYLDQAVNILSLFIEKWLSVARVKYKSWDISYTSFGYDGISLDEYEVYILANSWTASASEILIWTLKDYFPKITLIWEKTYGKWSVQTIKTYSDGSSFKYTIAKWYTGKTSTWIDTIWIFPDIKIDQNIEKFKSWIDTQLDYILNIWK